ncbi:MAG TPA: hypothetical protein VHN73_09840 [Phenylobacterium sp.]|nr:hypothetical protein [Phenylobacterium sp.]
MDGEDNIYQEAAALWQAMFSEPPPEQADGAALLDIIVAHAGMASYERLSSPYLRATTIAGPGQARL